MGKSISKRSRLFFLILYLFFIPTFALSEETYVFERMFPTLQQSWYFVNPSDIAVDDNGFIYVPNTSNHCIQKFNSEGQLITTWGSKGTSNGEFLQPTQIAIDQRGDVYIVDFYNNRIQKFNNNGIFITKWGSFGIDNGNFDNPEGIAVDHDGNVYVSDTDNHRIQKFTSDGQFITKWGSKGSEEGQFDLPRGIAVDASGNILVVDSNNSRIQQFTPNGQFICIWGNVQGPTLYTPIDISFSVDGYVYVTDNYLGKIHKFTSDGQYIMSWGKLGYGDDEFSDLRGICVDKNGYVYTVDFQAGIRKFSSEGIFITKWGSAGSNNAEFVHPSDIEIGKTGNVYVADEGNDRIQQFSADGKFTTAWGSEGLGETQFTSPRGIAFNFLEDFYVLDGAGYIRVFDKDGNFLNSWGGLGTDDGKFHFPLDIEIDHDGNVYVSDTDNDRIQKFTSDGQFITKWGSKGSEEGQFNRPMGIAIDKNNNIYIADNGNGRVQKFTADGQFISQWGKSGTPDERVINPTAIDIDSLDNIYVSHHDVNVKKYNTEGEFITKFGGEGSRPGEMFFIDGIAVNSNGKVYISEYGNNRIQVFKKVTIEDNSKAIVVAGGGLYSGNYLWNATQMNANFAYRTLTYQGFTKESIYYLTSDMDMDMDSNGVLDDVDGDATNANLQQAITSWAVDADSLVVYLVDHGGNSIFRMSGTETLFASDLDTWLDQLQQAMTGKVTVIYDACESGSFISQLTPPANKERLVITSTSSGEQAYFVTQGSVSFSNYFWTHIFNGVNVKDAFDLSKSALTTTTAYQHPLLDANGNGTGNETEDYTLTQNFYIGNGTTIYGDSPITESVSDPQTISDTNLALLFADGVSDNDGIARVWAIIRPPDYNPGESSNPVNDLPSVDLMQVGNNRFEATYDGFNIEGTYQLAIYARDRIGNTSIPVLTTVSVNNPLRRRAVIAIGGSQSDPIWPAMENLGTQAYESLIFQGYTDNDIYFMSPVTFSAGVDGLTTLSNLNYTIDVWAQTNTQDVVICLIGEGGVGTFKLSSTESLSASSLDSWIDTLQSNISGKVTVIYDAPQSGSFLPMLTPPADKKRVLISSTSSDGSAHFLSAGDISFSKFFWRSVLDGLNLRDAFFYAKNAISYCQGQAPQLDDNSNGIGNEKSDGNVARYYTLGVGIMLAGDDPLIGAVSPEQTLSGNTSASIYAENVTTIGTTDRVWAVITPPNAYQNTPEVPVTDLPSINLIYNSSSAKYEGTYSDFSRYGTYDIAVYAMDTEGNISMPSITVVIQTIGPDTFEEDDSFSTANVITINATEAQRHTFHDEGDQDWVMFYGKAGETYEIKTENLGSSCDTVLTLFDSDGTTSLTNPNPPDLIGDSYGYGKGELISWQCPADGIYYVMVKQYDSNVYGQDTEYDLRVYHPVGGVPGTFLGRVVDSSGSGIGGALVKSNMVNATALTFSNGYFILILPSGTYAITAYASGFEDQTHSEIVIGSESSIYQDFTMSSSSNIMKGNINGDDKVDLADAIIAFKVLSSIDTSGMIRSDYVISGADINNDSKIGLEEVIYILQEVSDIR